MDFIIGRKNVKTNLELEVILDYTISSFLKIIEFKDRETKEHSIRVSRLATSIARELKLDKESINAIKYASYLHDLGKIFIPSEILYRQGKLTEIEFNLVKEHVIKSYEVIKFIKFPYPTHQIVLQHHERLDGSGYPFGLKGKEILLESRILAVADVIDAMMSERPYRPPLKIELIIKELMENKNKLYDEKVVNCAIKLIMG